MNEHRAMLTCPCADEDRLLAICLKCGECFLFDPSHIVLIMAAFFFGAHFAWWWML